MRGGRRAPGAAPAPAPNAWRSLPDVFPRSIPRRTVKPRRSTPRSSGAPNSPRWSTSCRTAASGSIPTVATIAMPPDVATIATIGRPCLSPHEGTRKAPGPCWVGGFRAFRGLSARFWASRTPRGARLPKRRRACGDLRWYFPAPAPMAAKPRRRCYVLWPCEGVRRRQADAGG